MNFGDWLGDYCLGDVRPPHAGLFPSHSERVCDYPLEKMPICFGVQTGLGAMIHLATPQH